MQLKSSELPDGIHIRMNGRAVYGFDVVDFDQGSVTSTQYDPTTFMPTQIVDVGTITIWQLIKNRYAHELRPTTFKQITKEKLVTLLIAERLSV